MSEHGIVKITEACSVTPLDALSDNYMYLIADEVTKEAAVVDPADASTCVAAAQARGLTIKIVLTTHHHFDHSGGNNDLVRLVPDVVVVGGEDVQAITRRVADGEVLNIGRLTVRCVHTPSHTNGHMSYLVTDGDAAAAVFTGDALFVGGCGRFFEGGPEQMLDGATKLSALPSHTKLFCGHEYTVKNLQFALEVEPNNVDAQRKIMWAQEERASGRSTVPSTIGDELTYNPFLRCSQPAVRAYVGGAADAEVEIMRKLRTAKDKFAGTSRPWIPGGGPLPGL
mmetsp:Transcript_56875/g.113010  ORF Transcript_56875/g.113010 Transcript_56875/m.113010 type:complete len:283 (-) Transcript_56875:466-1314(-)